MAKRRDALPYSKAIDTINEGCWKDKTGNYFLCSLENLNILFSHLLDVKDACDSAINQIERSNHEKRIDEKLKRLK